MTPIILLLIISLFFILAIPVHSISCSVPYSSTYDYENGNYYCGRYCHVDYDCNGQGNSITYSNYPTCQCSCKENYGGTRCHCTNAYHCNGRASTVTGAYPTCTCNNCAAPYEGSSCQNQYCHIGYHCSGKGTGISGTYPSCTCTCDIPFTGASCNAQYCDKDFHCNKRATGISGTTYPSCTCTNCAAPWAGNACQTRICHVEFDCYGRGLSVKAGYSYGDCRCNCDTTLPYGGLTCDVRICHLKTDCVAGASAIFGTYPNCGCNCPPEYIGAKCEIRICHKTVDCTHVDRATNITGSYPSCTCKCTPQYIGSSCQTRICHLGYDCNGQGLNITGTYPDCQCTCPKGYVGRHCRTESQTLSLSTSTSKSLSTSKSASATISNSVTATLSSSASLTGTLSATYSNSVSASASSSLSLTSNLLSTTASKTDTPSLTASPSRSAGTPSASLTTTRSVRWATTATVIPTWTKSTSLTTSLIGSPSNTATVSTNSRRRTNTCMHIATPAATTTLSTKPSITGSLSRSANVCQGTITVCKMVYLYEATAAGMARATCDDSRSQSNVSLSASYNELALNNTNRFYYVVSSVTPAAVVSTYNLTGMADYWLISFVVSYQQSRNEVFVAAKDLTNETKVMGVRAFKNFITIIDVAIKILSLQWDEVIAKGTVMASGINVTFTESCEWPSNGSSFSRIATIERPVVYLPRKVFEKTSVNMNIAFVNTALSLSVGAVALPIAAIQQGVALSLVRMAQCDGDSLDGSVLDPSVHPLRFGLGDGITKYARGAVLGNLLIIPCVWAVLWYLVASHAVSAWRKQSLATSREFVGWPGVAIIPLSILSEGSAMACVALLFNTSNSALDAVMGSVGLALLLASMVACVRSLWLLSRLKSRSLECLPVPSQGILRLLKPRYEWLLVSRSKAYVDVDILLPSQVAKQEANESDAIAASYLDGRLAFVGDSWWMWSHVAASTLSVAVGVAEGFSLSDTSQCKTRWVFASAAAILQGLFVLTNTVLAEVALLGIVCLITLGLIIAISLSTFGVTEFAGGTFDALNALGIANSIVAVTLMVSGIGVCILEANTKANKTAVATSVRSTTVASFWGSTDAFMVDQELTQMPTLLIESDTEDMLREEARTLPPTAEHASSSNNYSVSLKLEKSL